MSFDDTLADAVVVILDAAKGGFPIAESTIEKRFLPVYDLADLNKPKIAVAPRTHTRDAKSRRASSRDHTIQICTHLIAGHTAGEVDDSRVAEFLQLVEAINDAIELAATAAGATWLRSATEPLYDPDQLQTGVLRSVLTVTYRRIAAAT